MRKKILVIESDFTASKALESLLNYDFSVTTASNGYDALTWVQHGNHADLIVVNADIQVLNSFDIMDCIRKLNGMMNVPVVLLSQRNAVEEYVVADRDAFFCRPYSTEAVAQKIYLMLGRMLINK